MVDARPLSNPNMAYRTPQHPNLPVPKLCLLSLDGGGTKGLVELLMLKEIMRRLNYDLGPLEQRRPCEVFDWIAGTGTGGVNALLLGRLGLSVEDAITAYLEVFRAVYRGITNVNSENALALKTQRFGESLCGIIKKHTGNPDAPIRPSTVSGCRTFVCSAPPASMAHPRLLRSYPVRSNDSHSEATIWEAARATAALPKVFHPITMGSSIKETLIGGNMLCNNPTWKLFQEARDVLPTQPIACILSLGSGNPGTISLTEISELEKVSYDVCNDCERTANDAERDLDERRIPYLRLNPEQGLQDWKLEEWNSESLGKLRTYVLQYLQNYDVQKSVDKLVELLVSRIKLKSVKVE